MMKQFVEYEKLSKKQKKEIDAQIAEIEEKLKELK